MHKEQALLNRWVVGLMLAGLLSAAAVCSAQQEPRGMARPSPLQDLKVSDYWVGIVSEPLPEALRAQLKLPADQGLLVERVAPGSPAAAAKVQRYDVLLKADGKTLAGVQDLIAVIDAAKGKTIALELLRRGKPMKLEVAPSKRPPDAARGPPSSIGGDPWSEAVRRWAEQFQPGDLKGRDYSFYFLRPGVVLGRPGPVPELPNGVTVSITKQGKSPVKIVVTRGTESWDLSEGELAALPADLRLSVEAVLRHPLRGVRVPAIESHLPSIMGSGAVLPPSRPKSLETELQEMKRRLDEMHRTLDDLKQRQSR